MLSNCDLEDVNGPHVLHKERAGSSSILPASLLSVLRGVGIQSEEELQSIPNDRDGVRMISRENEQAALSALGQALHTMARQLALNMISDDNLQAASNLQPARPPLAPVTEEQAEQEESDDSAATGERPAKKQVEAPQATQERFQMGGVNLTNTKILCQSEYAILQAALAEISECLDRLASGDAPISTVTVLCRRCTFRNRMIVATHIFYFFI